MSDEPNFETGAEPESTMNFKLDASIPVMILSISLVVLLLWQVSVASTQRTNLENLITRQEPAVTQSQQVQQSVSKLAADLLQAAQTDDTAKAIVTKYKIQQNTPAAGP